MRSIRSSSSLVGRYLAGVAWVLRVARLEAVLSEFAGLTSGPVVSPLDTFWTRSIEERRIRLRPADGLVDRLKRLMLDGNSKRLSLS